MLEYRPLALAVSPLESILNVTLTSFSIGPGALYLARGKGTERVAHSRVMTVIIVPLSSCRGDRKLGDPGS